MTLGLGLLSCETQGLAALSLTLRKAAATLEVLKILKGTGLGTQRVSNSHQEVS